MAMFTFTLFFPMTRRVAFGTSDARRSAALTGDVCIVKNLSDSISFEFSDLMDRIDESIPIRSKADVALARAVICSQLQFSRRNREDHTRRNCSIAPLR